MQINGLGEGEETSSTSWLDNINWENLVNKGLDVYSAIEQQKAKADAAKAQYEYQQRYGNLFNMPGFDSLGSSLYGGNYGGSLYNPNYSGIYGAQKDNTFLYLGIGALAIGGIMLVTSGRN